MPFNALEILWDTSQWQRLLMSYLLLTLPFFFVANAIALTMARYHDRIALIYGVDLIGAGSGAIGSMAASACRKGVNWTGISASANGS